jgi:hypothetical protein
MSKGHANFCVDSTRPNEMEDDLKKKMEDNLKKMEDDLQKNGRRSNKTKMKTIFKKQSFLDSS